MEMSEKGVSGAALWLLAIGALNWGLAIFNLNLITILSNGVGQPIVATILYAAVGLSGLVVLAKLLKLR